MFPDVSPSLSLLPPGPPGMAPRGTTGSRGTGPRSTGRSQGTRCSGTCCWGHVCPQGRCAPDLGMGTRLSPRLWHPGPGDEATSSPGAGPPWDSRGPAVTQGWHQKPPRSLGAVGTRRRGHPHVRGRGPGVPLPHAGPDPPSRCPCAHLGVPHRSGVAAVPREGTGLRWRGDSAKCHLCHMLSPPGGRLHRASRGSQGPAG